MDLERLLRAKREAILELAANNGANRVRVFGSVSRGEAGEDSDVDFLVEFDEDRSLLDHSRLILDLEKLLGRRVHVVTLGSLHRVIRDQVVAEARPL
ncbi:MAG: nucleotidyltransferase family protein [Actinomycetota bacterium]